MHGRGAGREAAKYRTRLREAEATLEALTNEHEAALTAERAKSSALKAAVLAAHNEAHNMPGMTRLLNAEQRDPGEFVADDGTIDTDALAKARAELEEAYGLQIKRALSRAPGAPAVPAAGTGSIYSSKRGSSWASVVRGQDQ